MEESSERLANFLLQFNLKEIQSLLSEEKKNFQIIEEEFLTIHQTGQVKALLTNLKTQIMQLSYTKVIETIDSTLKIQAVCEKFEETRKNSTSTKANVITISDDDIEEKNEKKHDILDKEIEFIIENDELYKSAIDKQKSSIKDLSPREELKSSKESPQEAKEATPAKSKRDIFKRLVIPKHDQDDKEDQLLAQQYLLLAQKDKDNIKNQGKRTQDQEKQLELLKRQQQDILDQIQGKKGKKYGKKDMDEEEFEEKEGKEYDDDGDGSGDEEFDDDYHQEKRRLKKLSALSQQSKSISKQGNNKNPTLGKIIHRKSNNSSNNSASKSQKKLTDSSKKSKSSQKESNSLTYDRSSEKINKQSYSSGFISQPQSYTEYLAHLINVTSDNNLPIPKIFMNELFYEKRRDGLKSVGTMLNDDDKQFVVEFYEALRGKLSKAEEYLLLSGELILGLVSQAQKKPPPFVLPEEVVFEEEEEEIVKTPRKRRIVDSENEEEEEEEKGNTFENEEKGLDRNGIRNYCEEERNEDSFECGFNVNKDKEKKIIKESEGSQKNNIISSTHNGDNSQKNSEKNNEKKKFKKGIRNEIYREESDEELRRSNEDLSIDSADARYRTNDIKSEHHDSEEQIYF